MNWHSWKWRVAWFTLWGIAVAVTGAAVYCGFHDLVFSK